MGKKSTPQAMSFKEASALADKQTAASQMLINQQTQANRINQVNPWGTKSFSQDPSGRWTETTTLSGQQQQALNDQMAIQAGKSGLAQGMMGQVRNATAQPFSTAGMAGWGAGGQAGQGMMGQLGQAGQIQAGVAGPKWIQGNIADAGQIQQGVGGTGLDSRMRLEQGLLGRLGETQGRETSALEGKLAGMGLTRGSQAWNREMQRMGDQQQRAQFGALQQGLQEQQGQFGMGLQAGQFGNQAQQQQFQQLMSQADLQNRAQGQEYGQLLQGAQFGNQAQQQAYNQMLQSGQFQNQAQAQQFQQQMAQSEYQNRLRAQQFGEAKDIRAMPLNELNALMSGSQVGGPQFGSYAQAGLAQTPQYLQAQQQAFGQQQDAASAANAGFQGMMQGAVGLAGMFGMSDARLKSNIVLVGEHPIGVGIYEYDIFGRRERGVMAQELQAVAPHLVAMHPSGYLMVNYGGL